MPRKQLSSLEKVLSRLAIGREKTGGCIHWTDGFGRHQSPFFFHREKFRERSNMAKNSRSLAATFVVAFSPYHEPWRKFFEHQDRCRAERRFVGEWTPPPLWTFDDGSFFEPTHAWKQKVAVLPIFQAAWRQWASCAWEVILAVSPNQRPDRNSKLVSGELKICEPRLSRPDSYYSESASKNSKRFVAKIRASPGIAVNDIKEAFYSGFEEIATGISPKSRQRSSVPDIGTAHVPKEGKSQK